MHRHLRDNSEQFLVYIELCDIVEKTAIDKEKAQLIRAHLAAFRDAVAFGHLDRDVLKALTQEFKARLVAVGFLDTTGALKGVPLRAEVIWTCFAKAIELVAEEIHPTSKIPLAFADTRNPDSEYCHIDLVTFSQLEYQVLSVRSGAKLLNMPHLMHVERHAIAREAKNRERLTEIVQCINAAIRNDVTLGREYLKGSVRSSVWLTPLEGRISDLVQMLEDSSFAQSALDEIRDLLGLWMEDGSIDRPLAAFILRCDSGMQAPNVITAAGYPRFRHRPASELANAPNAGLTFNLDRRRIRRYPGSCELVATGVMIGQLVDVRLCGQPSPFGFIGKAELTEHRRYAKAASGGHTWKQVIEALDTKL